MFKRKLTGLSGKAFLDGEIDNLISEVTEKRFIQAAITVMAVSFPVTAVIMPNQPDNLKLMELGIGSLFGGASALVAKSREDLENRYNSTLELSREVYKTEVKHRFAKEQAINDVTREANTAYEIMSKLPPQVYAEYAQKLQIPLGYFAEYLPQSVGGGLEPGVSPVNFTNNPIASPDAKINDLYVNPKVSAIIQQLAEQHPQYIRIDGKWITELIESSSNPDMSKRSNHHFMLVAETQAGKSTLGGLIAQGIADRSEQPATIAVHDAKKIPGKKDITRWLCNFTYKIDGYENADRWCDLSRELSSKQLDYASDVGGSCDGVPELILIQDEMNTCYGQGKGYGKHISPDTAKNLQAEWLFQTTNLAGVRGHAVFMGQSPLSGDTGLSRVAINNTCFIAMGETSGYILDPKNRSGFLRNISDDILNLLSQVCELFQSEGLRFALVRPTRGNPFVAVIPEIDVNGISQMRNKNKEPGVSSSESRKANTPVTNNDNIKDRDNHNTTGKAQVTHINIEEVKTQPENNQVEVLFKKIKNLYEILQSDGKTLTRHQVKELWEGETGKELGDKALDYLLEKLGIK